LLLAALTKTRALSVAATDRDNSNNINPPVVYENAETQKAVILNKTKENLVFIV
jgi:hypothetical protein